MDGIEDWGSHQRSALTNRAKRLVGRYRACPAAILLLVILFQFGFVMQDRGQQRTVDLDVAVVTDQPELAKLVHEETDAGSRRADHLRQRFLADVWTDRLRAALLPEICK